ncbi:hypothetical protein DM02DRAFT_734349 [Periconia macrospinosa]|uniref:Zn(2)-C6 fungal-type domain-containing protein n=1 Tax=Periconia macrospinosa TaxID=97972 RepID=A0A2V1D030_9PLEO|nr:hypothetical protein DM02DRAFT_734349 [Periconia macrospinosa]
MPSSRQEVLRLALEIQRNGSESPIPCDRCLAGNLKCIAMPENSSRLKCSECVRAGKPCVNMSWVSLDKTREEYQKKVDEDKKLLAEVIARLLKNKKILKQAEERAKKKAWCLANELREAGEEVDVAEDDCPAADALVGFSPAVWSTLACLDDMVGVVPFAEGSGS